MTTSGPSGVLERIGWVGIVPVVTIDDVDTAVPLARALVDGGLTAIEITLRTAAGLPAIAAVAKRVPDALVGAGTVLSADDAAAAIDAGARFVVSPGLDDGVVETSLGREVMALPGVATATELMRAIAMGLPAVKLFPAQPLGGPGLVRSLASAFPEVRFVPTGGISADTASDYLGLPCVLAVGGSWMVPAEAVSRRRWDDVERLASDAATLVTGRT